MLLQCGDGFFVGGYEAVFGDEAGDEAGGGDVEGVVGGGGRVGDEADAVEGAGGVGAVHPDEFVGGTGFDGDLSEAVGEGPVESGGGESDVEGKVVVAGGEGLEVGADFVGDIACARDAVGAGDDEVDEAMLHEVAAGVVGDDRVGDVLMSEFPGGEAGALVAGAGFIDPDMDGDAGGVGGVDGGGGGAVVDEGEPAGVAVGEDVDGLAGGFARGDVLDEGEAVLADGGAGGGVFVGDAVGFGEGDFGPGGGGEGEEEIELAFEGPGEIDGGGAAVEFVGFGDEGGGGVRGGGGFSGGEGHAVGGGGADAASAADGHVEDGVGDVGGGGEIEKLEVPREEALVNDADDGVVEPDGVMGGALDIHVGRGKKRGEMILCPKG